MVPIPKGAAVCSHRSVVGWDSDAWHGPGGMQGPGLAPVRRVSANLAGRNTSSEAVLWVSPSSGALNHCIGRERCFQRPVFQEWLPQPFWMSANVFVLCLRTNRK